MNYAYSQSDKDNLNWFKEDNTRASLKSIKLYEGTLRGLTPFEIEFEYPISVIAGKNGTGKSTLLALAACAYHNDTYGYKLPDRKATYYTFQNFFVQSRDEIPVEGIKIYYGILYNNWRKSTRFPKGEGLGYQARMKKRGGRWDNYDRRVKRNVIYYGINRIVPHNEKNTLISHKKNFESNNTYKWLDDVKDIVGKILCKQYDEFQLQNYNKYLLPIVRCKNIIYSGFNMGAGECALFEIFSTIFSAPNGTLLIIDEIELGLHGEAQFKLIEELKSLCKKRKVQIICTTHSKLILESVPPEARFFIENFDGKTIINTKIDADYAGAKLIGKNFNELDIFVEDDKGKKIIEQSLDDEHRKRVMLHHIGSATAIARQLSAFYKLNPRPNCIAFLDGDQTTKKTEIVNRFAKYLEATDDIISAKKWAEERICFLLSEDTWPEKCILEMFKKIDKTDFIEEIRTSSLTLENYIDEAIISGKHNEFYTLSQKLGCDADFLFRSIVSKLNKSNTEGFSLIRERVSGMLP